MEKANSYPWIPGGGMAIEVSVEGKVSGGVTVGGDGSGGGGESDELKHKF